MPYFVYELVDPRTDVVAYVGITDNPDRRFQSHLRENKTNGGKRAWIKELRSEHLEPHMRVLETVETREEALELEKRQIQQYLRQGINLVNIMHQASPYRSTVVGQSRIASENSAHAVPTSHTTGISYPLFFIGAGAPKIDRVNGTVYPGKFDKEAMRAHVIEDIKRPALYSSNDSSDAPKEVVRTHWLKW